VTRRRAGASGRAVLEADAPATEPGQADAARPRAAGEAPPRGRIFRPPIHLVGARAARRLSPEQVGLLATVESWVIPLEESADVWPDNLFDVRRLLWCCFPGRSPEVVDLFLATFDLVVEARLADTDGGGETLAAYWAVARQAGGGLASVMPGGRSRPGVHASRRWPGPTRD
jgi:hypothetical protein